MNLEKLYFSYKINISAAIEARKVIEDCFILIGYAVNNKKHMIQ